jgi:hypothetical protein
MRFGKPPKVMGCRELGASLEFFQKGLARRMLGQSVQHFGGSFELALGAESLRLIKTCAIMVLRGGGVKAGGMIEEVSGFDGVAALA